MDRNLFLRYVDACAVLLGFQGGSVVKHILQDGRFAIRALTRQPHSSRAKGEQEVNYNFICDILNIFCNILELIRAGAIVVEANFDDLSSLRRAFEGMCFTLCLCFISDMRGQSILLGCYGAFGVTDYFDAFEKEAQQGNNIVEAAKLTGLKHLVIRYVSKRKTLDEKLSLFYSTAPGLADTNVESFKYKYV